MREFIWWPNYAYMGWRYGNESYLQGSKDSESFDPNLVFLENVNCKCDKPEIYFWAFILRGKSSRIGWSWFRGKTSNVRESRKSCMKIVYLFSWRWNGFSYSVESTLWALSSVIYLYVRWWSNLVTFLVFTIAFSVWLSNCCLGASMLEQIKVRLFLK